MRARVNLAKECFDEKRAIVVYCNTHQMRADGVSKVLEGKSFEHFAHLSKAPKRLCQPVDAEDILTKEGLYIFVNGVS